MEGAATDVKAAASSLHKISKDIREKQRLYRIAELVAATKNLEQQIQSAKLALQQIEPKQIQ